MGGAKPYSRIPYPLNPEQDGSVEHDYSNSYSGSGGFDGADTLLEAR